MPSARQVPSTCSIWVRKVVAKPRSGSFSLALARMSIVSSASQSPVSTSMGPPSTISLGGGQPVAVEAAAVGDPQRFGVGLGRRRGRCQAGAAGGLGRGGPVRTVGRRAGRGGRAASSSTPPRQLAAGGHELLGLALAARTGRRAGRSSLIGGSSKRIRSWWASTVSPTATRISRRSRRRVHARGARPSWPRARPGSGPARPGRPPPPRRPRPGPGTGAVGPAAGARSRASAKRAQRPGRSGPASELTYHGRAPWCGTAVAPGGAVDLDQQARGGPGAVMGQDPPGHGDAVHLGLEAVAVDGR